MEDNRESTPWMKFFPHTFFSPDVRLYPKAKTIMLSLPTDNAEVSFEFSLAQANQARAFLMAAADEIKRITEPGYDTE